MKREDFENMRKETVTLVVVDDMIKLALSFRKQRLPRIPPVVLS